MPLIEAIPHLDPVNNQEWRELWPDLASMLRHLLQPAPTPADEPASVVPALVPVPQTNGEANDVQEQTDEISASVNEFHTAADESPLTGEALLSRPGPPEMVECSRDFGQNLLEILNRVVPPIPSLPSPPAVPVRHTATFVSDNNITDGQIFPPGAEFVKSWVMHNDGETAWPEETTLRYVAGHRMQSREDAALSVPVGCVPPGAEAELFAGEMKVSVGVLLSSAHY